MTLGISPKVQAFIAAIGGPGLILLALGLILDDSELRTAGLALLVGSGVGGLAGYKAPPGEIAIDVGPASDALMPPAAMSVAESTPAPPTD